MKMIIAMINYHNDDDCYDCPINMTIAIVDSNLFFASAIPTAPDGVEPAAAGPPKRPIQAEWQQW